MPPSGNMNENINKNGMEMMKKLYFWEKDRLASFSKWPFGEKSKCNPKKMAEAGFYWCGTDIDEDTAACFVCDKHLNGWEEEDDPWEEHFSHAPQCVFAKTRKPESQLLVEEILSILEATTKGYLQRQLDITKKQAKEYLEEQRKELIKTFSR